jgi:hypothetical protein
VRTSLGKVAVGSLAVGEGALRSVLAVSNPARRWVLPAAGAAGATDLVVLAPGIRRVPFDVLAQAEDGQEVLVEDESLSGHTAETLSLEAGGAWLVVQGQGRAPFVVGHRLRSAPAPSVPAREPPGRDGGPRRNRDQEPAPPPPPADSAGAAGAPTPVRSWLTLPCLPPAGGTSLLTLENPGSNDVAAEVRLLGADGPSERVQVEVPAGRSAIVELAPLVGEAPVTAAVTADGPVVAAQAGRASEGYAVCLGIPL